jgi:hypothetical protein
MLRLAASDTVKPYSAVTAVYRNRMTDFDDRLILNAAGLWNFYLDAAQVVEGVPNPVESLVLFPNKSFS